MTSYSHLVTQLKRSLKLLPSEHHRPIAVCELNVGSAFDEVAATAALLSFVPKNSTYQGLYFANYNITSKATLRSSRSGADEHAAALDRKLRSMLRPGRLGAVRIVSGGGVPSVLALQTALTTDRSTATWIATAHPGATPQVAGLPPPGSCDLLLVTADAPTAEMRQAVISDLPDALRLLRTDGHGVVLVRGAPCGAGAAGASSGGGDGGGGGGGDWRPEEYLAARFGRFTEQCWRERFLGLERTGVLRDGACKPRACVGRVARRGGPPRPPPAR